MSEIYRPTTFSIRKVVDNVPNDIFGIWSIKKGKKKNPMQLSYCSIPKIQIKQYHY